ncbi:MAG: T9SS type A sorting domain-containing protein [Flavobacteriales bacterium]|jgi:hypothetical protein|nr:T9SS type A sorting domain-containing protein [Flavobacteriales bacterium]
MRFTLLLLVLPFLSQAQKWADVDIQEYPLNRKQAKVVISSETVLLDTVSIKAFLTSKIEVLKHSQAGLLLESQVHSPKASHYHFVQTFNGRTVFRGSVKVSIAENGRVLSLFDHTFRVLPNTETEFPDSTAFIDWLLGQYDHDEEANLHRYDINEVYFPVEDKLIPAIGLEIVEKNDSYFELILNKNQEVIYQNNLLSYAPPQDSTATLWVFNPDPLTSAEEMYGSPYSDSFDQDVFELNAERVSFPVDVTFENDTFFLRNDYASIEEFSFPDVDITFSLTPEFNFTRSESGFEDANAFYHISNFQQYIQSLGFTNLVDYPIHIDAHALNGSDNSNFNPGFNPPRLSFGEGGVDDAEDADVIIHEYGHAIMHSAAPGTNNGTERKALDEAVGDYFASSYSRFLSNYGWSDVFSWDGHNEFWNGRSTLSSDHYPEDLNSNIYSDADIWSATLMQIWEDIGREATDAIMLQAAYSFSEGMSMPQAALLFLQADTLLFGGTNFIPIRQRMFDRGLIPWNVGIEEVKKGDQHFQVFNTIGFTNGNGTLRVTTKQPFDVHLYNAIGQVLRTERIANGDFFLSSDGFNAGVYLLKMEDEAQSKIVKLIKH